MGAGGRQLGPLRALALALALACTWHPGRAQVSSPTSDYEPQSDVSHTRGHGGDPLSGVTIIPPLRTIPVVRALNPAHNGRVCSAWGDFHYKTFDGDVFRFPGLCNYVFSAHCGAAYEDFNVQLRRGRASNATTVRSIVMKLDGLVVELNKSSVLVDGRRVQLPFSHSGVLIESGSGNLKLVARLGLVFMWNHDDSLLLELDAKYANRTCGLCGDFNGIPVVSEFLSHDVRLTALEFGNLQKMDGPTEQCQDPVPEPQKNCSTGFDMCEDILRGPQFSGCRALVDVDSYVEACRQDLCLCEHGDLPNCTCHTLAEYSRQCAHAGGRPQDWRGPGLCSQTCPFNMQHQECSSPCVDTCSDPQRSQVCEDHCVAGCFCPEGMVLDDIGETGCVPVSQCACRYNGTSYAPGTNYSTDCSECTCSGGRWSCQDVPCPGTCSVLGGAHFSTFDEREYTVHGDCSYVLTKTCNSSDFTVLAELRRCGLTDSETCLKSVTLSLGGGHTVVVVKASGEVFVNQIYTQLPVSAANVTLFRPSNFFIIAQTHLGLQLDVQLVPSMQVFVRLAPELRGLTCGLCGNFNSIQADDFRTISGVVEGTAAAFLNTFKTQAACPNVKNTFEDPCALSVENEKYAQHWCSQLTSTNGSFARCHGTVSPSTYYSNCMFDTCNCENSEDCLCAALASYVRACAAKGVLLSGWRDGICAKPTTTCPKSMTYHYNISTCQPTCRALSEEDVTCHVSFVPVDGCACPKDTFLDDSGKCVQASSCPCYYRGSTVPSGESVHDSGAICTCTQGNLTCIGGHDLASACDAPMVYFDCRNATAGATGAGCQKSCHTLDMACYSTQCVSGCVCPEGLVEDGDGGCVPVEDCPCVHNEATYRPGETILVGCNTCTCESRMWRCTDEPCLGTCVVYGDGHLLTFDGLRYTFTGDCEYTLLQDHCGGNSSAQDAFHVVTENVPCGTTGTTCFKDIKIFLGSYELMLSGGKVDVVQKGTAQEAPYSIRHTGIYLVVKTDVGLEVLWDRKTSVFLRLSPEFKGRVCGLCGNFDDNAVNDFTTRSRSVVSDALEFGNSWKFSPSCPDAPAPRDPCTTNPYRKSWAQKQCSIINGEPFATCHAQVEPAKYYEACVSDACACDTGGDCECFCTAVAAYAQACHDAGVCVSWRTPDICPLFCDYYNAEGQCTWHYRPCGNPCLRTCRNPSGRCLHDQHGLEGCYPKCPSSAPIFDEDKMQCVATCPSPPPPPPCHVHGKSYQPGATVPSDQSCHSCVCTENGVRCAHDAEACPCTYDGQHFHRGDVIYNTTDGVGGCISAQCGPNGTIERSIYGCGPATPFTPSPPATFSFSTAPLVVTSIRPPDTYPSPAQSTVHVGPLSSGVSTATNAARRMTPVTASTPILSPCGDECLWSPWLDVSRPGRGNDSGDFDTLENLRAHGHWVCQAPKAVECRAEDAPEVSLHVLGQHVECSPTVGLTCHNRDQASGLCHNYQIRILCCSPLACLPSNGPGQTTILPPSRVTKMGATASEESPTTFLVPVTTTGPATVLRASTPVPVSIAPSSSTPAPGTFTPAPGSSTPAPGSSTPAPGSSTPAPGTSTPAPGSSTPAPGTSTPAPGSSTPASGSSTPAPGSSTPATGTSTPAPGSSQPDSRSVTHTAHGPTPATGASTHMETTLSTSSPTPVAKVSTTSSVSASAPGTLVGTGQQTSRETSRSCFRELCSWTEWMDGSYPGSSRDSGDFDTFQHLRAKGYKFCENPTSVECRAKFFPNTPLAELGQDVTCNRKVGLICLNKNQLPPMCYNYEIRVQCCETADLCSSTQATTVTRPHQASTETQVSAHTAEVKAHSATTPTASSPSSTAGPKTSSPSVHVVSTTSVPKTSTASVHTASSSSVHTASSFSLPKTSSASVHTASSSSVPKTSTTSVHTASTTSVPITSSTLVHTARSFSVPISTSTSVHTARTTSLGKPSTTSVSTATTGHVSTLEMTLSPEVTTGCRSQCNWTKWFDVDSPEPGKHGGDMETYGNIVARGEKLCHRPEEITRLQCRAENHPEVSVEQLGQVVQCNPEVGLVCRNRDQHGKLAMCLNYEVRVLCCRTPEGCPTSAPVTVPEGSSASVTSLDRSTSPVLTASTTSVPMTSSTPVHAASSSSVPKTSSASVHTASSFSLPKTSPTSVHTASTTSVPITSSTSVHAASSSSLPETSSTSVYTASSFSLPKTSSTSVHAASSSSVPKTSTNSVHTASTTTVPVTSSTSVHTDRTTSLGKPSTTSVSTATTGHVSTLETTPSPEVTTGCRSQCNWTKWFDVDSPEPGKHGGDMETYGNIVARGEKLCHRPEEITRLQCRAENHPEVSVEQLGQVVQCNPEVGLVCRNRDQHGKLAMCLNYEVRVLCCRTPEGCPTSAPVTVPEGSSASVTSLDRSTSPVLTASTTSVPMTSSTPVHAASSSSVPKTSTTPLHTASSFSLPKTSATPVHAASSSSVPKTSSGSVHTASSFSLPKTSPTSVLTASTTSVPITSSTPVHTASSSSVPKTSSASLHTASSFSLPKTSSISVHTASTTSVPITSSTSVHAASSSSLPETSSTSVYTASSFSLPKTSSTSVHTASSFSLPKTSSTSVHTASSFSLPKTSSASVHTASSFSLPKTSSASVHTASSSSVPKTSTTSVHIASTTSVPITSSTSVHEASSSSLPETSSTSVHTASTTSVPITSSTPVHAASSSSVPKTSTTPLHTASSFSLPKTSATPVHAASSSSLPETRSTSVYTASSFSLPKTSSASVHTASSFSLPKTSSTSVHTASSFSLPKTSSTSVHTASTTTVPITSSTSVHAASSSSLPETSSTSVHTASSFSLPKTSSASLHTASSFSLPKTSSTSVHAASSSSVPKTSTNSVHTASTTTVPVTSSTSVHTDRTTSLGKPSTTSVSTATTGHVSTLETTPTPEVTTGCRSQCNWTKWFDVDSPEPGKHGGDMETYGNIVARGEKLCHRPEEITRLQCRAENHPEVSVEQLGQVVQCNPEVGLVCRNRDQHGKLAMCLNYEVRVLCCRTPEGCPTSAPVTVPEGSSASVTSLDRSTSPVLTASTTSMPITSSTPVHAARSSSVPKTSLTSVHAASSSSVHKTSSASLHTASSFSMPKTSSPSVHTASTTSVPITSSTPVHAASSSSVPKTSSASVHTASSFSLPKTSSASVHTASSSSVPKTSTTSVHTASTTTVPITSSTSVHAASSSSLPETSSASLHTVSSSSLPETSSTSVHTASSFSLPKTSSASLHTASSFSMPKTSSTPVHAASSSTVPKTSSTSVHAASSSSVPKTSTNSLHTASTTSVPVTSSTSVHTARTTSLGKPSTTSVSTATTGHVSTLETTLSPEVTTGCQLQCNWTKWFDVDSPEPGKHGGDMETYGNIVARGEKLCHRPEEITRLQCRAENHPEVSVEQLGQVVQCNPEVGLVCRNRDQHGKLAMCLNYEVRVLCCRTPEGCPTSARVTVPEGSSASVTILDRSTSTVHTASTTSVPMTSSTPVHAASSSSVPKTSSASVHTASSFSLPKTSPTSVLTASTTSVPITSSTPVHAASSSSVPKTSSASLHTASSFSLPKTSPTSVLTASTTSVPITSSTPVHAASSSSVPKTSSASLHTASSFSLPKTSSISVHTASTTSVPITSSTSVHTASSFTLPKTSSASVHTASSFSLPKTSSASVHTASSSSVPKTSTTSVHIASTTSVPITSSTSVHEASSSSLPETSSTSVHTASTTSVPITSSTPVHAASSSSVPKTSTTPLHTASSFSLPKTSATPVHAASSSSLPETRSTSVYTASSFSLPKTSSASVHAASSSSVHKTSSAFLHTASSFSLPKTSSASVHTASSFSLPKTSSTSVHTASSFSLPKTSSTSVHTASTTTVPITSSTSVHAASSSSLPETSSTSVHTASSFSLPKTSSASLHTASSFSLPKTSSTSVHAASSSSVPKTSTNSVHTASTTTVPVTSSTSVHTDRTTSLGKPSTTSVSTATTGHVSTLETTPSPEVTTGCRSQCNWTKWFDVDSPEPGKHGGDMETYGNIVARGEKLCHRPEEITRLQCRAENHPEVSVEQLGQVVQCNPEVGLVCRNRDQHGKLAMCLNYEVRVLCCRTPEGCPTSAPVTVPEGSSASVTSLDRSTSPVLTASTTSMPITSSTPVHAARSSSVPKTSLTSVHAASSSSVHKTSSASLHTASSFSMPKTSSPSVHTASTTSVPITSSTPVHAASSSSVPKTSSASVHTASSFSLPKTSSASVHTASSFSMPKTSSASVHTASSSSVPKTSTTSVHTASTTTVPITSSTSVHAASSSSLPETSSASLHTVSSSSLPETSSTSVHTASSFSLPKTSSASLHTASSFSMPKTSSTPVHAASSSTVPKTSSTSVHAASSSSVPKTSTNSLHTASTTSVPVTSSTSVHPARTPSLGKPSTTSVSTATTGHVSTLETTLSPEVTTGCQSQCNWTKWFDVDSPEPGKHGGDMETYGNIVARGEKLCHRPEEITRLQCRAENHPEVSVEQLGQVVQCNPEVGLVCRNRDQHGKLAMCLNYEVRVLCCRTPEGCPTSAPVTVPEGSSASVTILDRSTSTVHTASTTSVPMTSSTPVHAASSSSVPKTSSASVHTASSFSLPKTSSISVHTASTTSVPITSSTSVHAASSSSLPETSSTSVYTASSFSLPKTSSTSVHTASSFSLPKTSSTSVHTASSFTLPKTSSASVHTASSFSLPKTSSASVHTASSSSVPKTSTTSVHIASTTSVPITSSTSVHEASSSSLPETSSTSVRTASSFSLPETSSTSVHTASTTSVPITSSTSVHAASSSSLPETSSTSVYTASSFSLPKTSSTSVHTASSFSLPKTSSASVHAASSSSVHKTSSASLHTASSFSLPKTSSASVHTASSFSLPKTSSASVHTASTTSVPITSSTPVHAASSSSVPKTSSASVHTASSFSLPKTSSASVHTASTTSVPITSSTSVHTASSFSVPKSTSISVHTARTTSLGKPSTTSASTATTGHVSTLETTLSPEVTTGCRSQCNWTKWFDVDSPEPGKHGGDMETYGNIIARGEKICHRPEEITRLQCRAENHTEVSVEQLGQVVQCNPEVGLVCRNRDQHGKLAMCLNYEVRVLCCRTPEGCPLRTVTPFGTSPAETSFQATSTSSLSPSWSPSPAARSTPTCFCSVSDKLYPAGFVIYQQRDLAGHCYQAQCSLDCHVVRSVNQDCPSITSVPTVASSLSLSTSASVTELGCPNLVPPRRTGETWAMPNCTQATCEGNRIVSLSPRQCPEVEVPTCANGYPALRVADQDGCCYHYHCQCVCSGWGDPHYITFDGTYYTFLDNCTYVLVQQIVPVFGHFRVLVDNYYCDAEDAISCPQSIIVEYHRERVVLTRRPVQGVMTNQIIFNDKVVSPGFQENGVAVSRIGIKMYVTIQAIGVQVMFSGLIFSVEVPFSTFSNNTEGQCGTCTNDLKDECRLPGGTVATSCSEMAPHWRVNDPDQPYCRWPSPTPTSAVPTTLPTECPPSPVCQLILSGVFEPCHAVVPPEPFFKGCVFDYCHVTEPEVLCSSLQLYASLCTAHGVCVDWRGRTNHTCPFSCPADKVYRPCGPSNTSYCYGSDVNASLALPEAGPITEGCFCPDSMRLFSATAPVCVPEHCPWCIGPQGEPVEPGHTVSVDCQEYTCEGGTLAPKCHSKPCPLPAACPLPGFVPVPAPPEAGQCCPQFNCTCNSSYCPEPLDCPKGSHRVVTYEEGACCPSESCRWTVCSINGTLYQPGTVVSATLCETCRCEVPSSAQSDAFVVTCEMQKCNTHCPVGFEYQAQSGQCCGQCVQVACVVNSTHLVRPGESWSEPGNRCVTHKCEKHRGGLTLATVEKECPSLNCSQAQAQLSTDGCCYFCPQITGPTCAVHHEDQVIRQQNCSSAGPVRLSYCQGTCGETTSKYSLEASRVQHHCQCCQELRTSRREVTLRCADGSSRAFSYTQVEQCGCLGQQCQALGDTSHSASSESASSESASKSERSQESES